MDNFKSIKNFPGYFISRDGEILSFLSGVILVKKVAINTHGYPYTSLRNNGKTYSRTVHRLVAETFLEKDTARKHVNHKDGNKENSCVDNLEWCTPKENIDHLLNALKKKVGPKNLKLDSKKILEIRDMLSKGITHKKISERFHVDESMISKINTGKAWV